MTNSEAAAIIRILLVEPVDKWPALNRKDHEAIMTIQAPYMREWTPMHWEAFKKAKPGVDDAYGRIARRMLDKIANDLERTSA